MGHSDQVTQEFLDSAQYATASILRYETVYGEDFVSPGGREITIELVGGMKLAPESRVLDVGCGLGGSAFVMARDFNLRVDGIDLSKNMLAIANEKLRLTDYQSGLILNGEIVWSWIAPDITMRSIVVMCFCISRINRA